MGGRPEPPLWSARGGLPPQLWPALAAVSRGRQRGNVHCGCTGPGLTGTRGNPGTGAAGKSFGVPRTHGCTRGCVCDRRLLHCHRRSPGNEEPHSRPTPSPRSCTGALSVREVHAREGSSPHPGERQVKQTSHALSHEEARSRGPALCLPLESCRGDSHGHWHRQ